MKILLKTAEDVKDFSRVCSELKGEIEIVQGRWRVPGSSLMGLFSLDLSKPLNIIFDENEDIVKSVISPWRVE